MAEDTTVSIDLSKRMPSTFGKWVMLVTWFAGLGGTLWLNHNHLGDSTIVTLFVVVVATLLVWAMMEKARGTERKKFSTVDAAIEWLNEQKPH